MVWPSGINAWSGAVSSDGYSVPRIPARYSKPEGRYLAQPSLNPIKLFSGGNIITNIFLLTVLGLLLLCGFIVYVVIRKIRKRLRNKG